LFINDSQNAENIKILILEIQKVIKWLANIGQMSKEKMVTEIISNE